MGKDERESNASRENDKDELMRDAEEADRRGDKPEGDRGQTSKQDTATTADLQEDKQDHKAKGDGGKGEADAGADGEGDGGGAKEEAPRTSASPHDAGLHAAAHWKPTVTPAYVNAKLYDIVPTMAAPQSTSINAISITPDLRYWMTGGSDGYIRKYDGAGTINGKQLLTVAQRHPFVDSVVKAGILMSYWENEEPTPPNAKGTDEHVLSPVYSLAVHSRALWLLSGLESGGINLQSVRHDEGKRIACLQQHTNAVSVLSLSADEKGVLSGSWDKNIFDWDLNNGQVRRQFDGSGSQISALETRPANAAPIPPEASGEPARRDTFASNNGAPLPAGALIGDTGGAAEGFGQPNADLGSEAPGGSEHESLFGSPGGSLFGEDGLGGTGFGGDDDNNNEFSDAMLALQGDSSTAQRTGGQPGDVTMTDIDMSSAPPLDPNAAPPPAVQPLSGANASTTDRGPGIDPPPALPGTGFSAGASLDFGAMPPPGQPAAALGATDQATMPGSPSMIFASDPPPTQLDTTQSSDSTFFSASIDGTIRVWDRRVPNPVARIGNRPGVPPWCMGACWSPDGNWIYAGRRNGTVEEFNIHKARHGWEPNRTLKFPPGSGPVSALRPMVNGRHLVCASHDILRLYDLRDQAAFKHSSVPFLIIPGPPRAGVISHLYIDPTSRFMISAAGTRGWEGSSTEVIIGYEINVSSG